MMPEHVEMPAATNQVTPDWREIVAERVKSLRFGKIELLVHQGRVTQVEVSEKIRLEDTPAIVARPLENEHRE